jgi:ubiquinone/menaquinone biosynthesis C-methylase UbiE
MVRNIKNSVNDKNNLEVITENYNTKIICGWENLYKEKRKRLFQKFIPFFDGYKALELGVGDGEMSIHIVKHFTNCVFVDGSKTALEKLKIRIGNTNFQKFTFIHSYVENLKLEEKFDAIFLTHLLEHLSTPISVLKTVSQFLRENGKIFIAVPNANSLHRHIGVAMGMLESINSLNEQDILLGHKRVYTPQLFKKHIRTAGLEIIHFGGLMIKPLSNRQMENWDHKIIDALFNISDILPEYCSEIYCVAQKKRKNG